MIHMERQREQRQIGYIVSLAVLIFLLILFSLFSKSVARRGQEESLHALTAAIQRASVQCYALEGRYPPSVEYLEEHYGISIDRERYNVFYDGWASNIMPDITIIPVEGP